MEIIVHQAILHVLDTTLDAPVLSGSCMEMTAEKTAYLQYHIEKLLASDDIRQCRPLPDSAFRYELEQNKDFIDLSCRIGTVGRTGHGIYLRALFFDNLIDQTFRPSEKRFIIRST